MPGQSPKKTCICSAQPGRKNPTECENKLMRERRTGLLKCAVLIRSYRRDVAIVDRPGTGRTGTAIEKRHLSQYGARPHQSQLTHAESVARAHNDFKSAAEHKVERLIGLAVANECVTAITLRMLVNRNKCFQSWSPQLGRTIRRPRVATVAQVRKLAMANSRSGEGMVAVGISGVVMNRSNI